MRVLLLLTALVVGVNLEAQSVRVKRWSQSTRLDTPSGHLTALVAAYSVGDLDSSTTLLRELTKSAYLAIDSTQTSKHDLLISFVAKPPMAKTHILVTLLLPGKEGLARPLPTRIPGVSTLTHLYFSVNPREDVRYSWTSEEQEDASLSDLNKFAVLLAGGVAQVASAISIGQMQTLLAPVGQDTPSEKEPMYVVADSLFLPHKRSKLAFEIVVGGPMVAFHILRSAIDSSESDVALNTAAANSSCALSARRELKGAAQRFLGDIKWERGVRLDSLHRSLVQVFSTAVGTPACAAPSERALAERVLQRFTVMTTAEPRRVEGKNALVNAPTRYLSVGSVFGVPVGRPLGDNLAIESDRVVRRPLNGLLTSAVVHLHRGVDPTSVGPSTTQRLSLFGGVVITPREGLIAGLSLQLWRGLGVHASHAWMRSNIPRDSTVIPGTVPPSEGPAFRSRVSGRYALGFAVKL